MTSAATEPFLGGYYHHSGKFSPVRTPLAILAGSLAAVILGTGYAFGLREIPFIFVHFIFTVFLGVFIGVATWRVLRWAHVRSLPLTSMAAILITGTGLVAAWVTWLSLVFRTRGIRLSPFEFLVPTTFGKAITLVYQDGAWGFTQEASVSGPVLGIIWLIETAVIFYFAVVPPLQRLRDEVYCESCNRWGEARSLVTLAPSLSESELRTSIERGDYTLLHQAKLAADPRYFLHLSFRGCPNCDNTQTLCLDNVTITVDKEGKEKTKTTHLINRLRLSPEQTVEVATIAATLIATAEAEANARAEAEAAQTAADASTPPTAAAGDTTPV